MTLEEFKNYNKSSTKDNLINRLYDREATNTRLHKEIKDLNDSLNAATEKLHKQEVMLKQFLTLKAALVTMLDDDIERIASDIAETKASEAIDDHIDAEYRSSLGDDA